MDIGLEIAKGWVARAASTGAEVLYGTSTVYLPTGILDTHLRTEEVVRQRFSELSSSQKSQVYGKVWELAKMADPRIQGARWGEEHAFDHIDRLASALHRLGFLGQDHLYPVPCLPFGFGEGGLGSQYFSLSEKLGKDPATGPVSYVNGMGICCFEHAGKDVLDLSNLFVDGNNIHCVYNSTHQKNSVDDAWGFAQDAARMKAVDGGSYTKTSYLIAQQWIDHLSMHPSHNYLQVAASEGTAHVNAALRLIQNAQPALLSRLRILNFCPAYFILPDTYSQELQVMNLVKREDKVINPWGTGVSQIGKSRYIHVVPHTPGSDPHNCFTDDFVKEGKRYVDEFMRSGNIYNLSH